MRPEFTMKFSYFKSKFTKQNILFFSEVEIKQTSNLINLNLFKFDFT